MHVAGRWGWHPGTRRLPVRDPHPSVSEDDAHIDQRFHFLDPDEDSVLGLISLPPHQEGKMLGPAWLVEPSRLQDRILGPLHHPLGIWVDPGECGHLPEGAGEECEEWSTHLPSPTSPPQRAHQHFPLAGIFFCGVKLKFCRHLPAGALFIHKRANPDLVGLDHSSCHLPQLSLLQLATETVESKSPASNKSLKKKPQVYMYIITPFSVFCMTQSCDALDSSPVLPSPTAVGRHGGVGLPQEHACPSAVTSHVTDTLGSR